MLIILVFSHDFSIDNRYSDMLYYKTIEQKAIDYYVKSNVEYRLIKYNLNIEGVYEEKGNTLYIKGCEAYDFETCNYKDKIAFNYFYKKYKYIYKSTITSIPNIYLLLNTITYFENTKAEIVYCGPIFKDINNNYFVGGFSLLLNNKAIDIILNKEWNTNDDVFIGNILRSYMTPMSYFANHEQYHEYYKNLVYSNIFSVKFVMYKENRIAEKDYMLHDIVTIKFLNLLKLD